MTCKAILLVKHLLLSSEIWCIKVRQILDCLNEWIENARIVTIRISFDT